MVPMMTKFMLLYHDYTKASRLIKSSNQSFILMLKDCIFIFSPHTLSISIPPCDGDNSER